MQIHHSYSIEFKLYLRIGSYFPTLSTCQHIKIMIMKASIPHNLSQREGFHVFIDRIMQYGNSTEDLSGEQEEVCFQVPYCLTDIVATFQDIETVVDCRTKIKTRRRRTGVAVRGR